MERTIPCENMQTDCQIRYDLVTLVDLRWAGFRKLHSRQFQKCALVTGIPSNLLLLVLLGYGCN